MNISISDEELNALTHAILKRYGVDFTCYEPKSLKRRVIRCISVFKLKSIHELWVKMLRDSNFIHNFMNEVSVGLTAMFRDPVLWRALRDRVLPDLAHKEVINIWHAGCSTGEEVYTMGIVLEEAGLLHKAKALATDMNLDAIETAKEGKYHKLKLTEYANNYAAYRPFSDFHKYYQKADDDHGILDPNLIRHVTFDFHNLITQKMDQQFDIIFCRNVMIYFDAIAKARLIEQFHQSLNPSGYFIIGFYDALHSMMDKAKFESYDVDAKIFYKHCPVSENL